MSRIYHEKLIMPCCKLHRDNPFPILKEQFPQDRYENWRRRVSPELGKYFGYGARHHHLPYPVQDGYGDSRENRETETIVLENNRMKAVFLPGFGGRLWSLYDKAQSREVFYRNTVLQEGNLAVCNAWFSGGAEWNFGVYGHTPLTASPLFAAKLTNADGQTVLRMYEYERIRETPYQLDFFFPDDDSPLLCLKVRITNVDAVDKPVYYWSNLAFPDLPSTRVLVESDRALITSEQRPENAFPYTHGSDFSYSENIPKAVDLFFLPNPERKRSFEAVVNADGQGLISIASPVIEGRKLFVWGNSTGGRHWQSMLTDGVKPYLEIQTGLGTTQLESRTLKADSEYTWLEVFAPIDIAPEKAHDASYPCAVGAARAYMEKILPYEKMLSLENAADKVAAQKPEAILHHGSGWGALETLRRQRSGEKPFPVSMPFPLESMGELQRPFIELLEGRTPDEKYITLPAWQCSKKWQKHFDGDSAFNLYQRSIYAYTQSDFASADAFAARALAMTVNKSVKLFLLRFIAVNHFLAGEYASAVEIFNSVLTPDCDFQLYLDAAASYRLSGQNALFASLLERAEVPQEFSGRRKLMLLQSALECNDLETAEKVIESEFKVVDLREGELALEELFLELQTKKLARAENVIWNKEFHDVRKNKFAIPEFLDYRMIPEEKK